MEQERDTKRGGEGEGDGNETGKKTNNNKKRATLKNLCNFLLRQSSKFHLTSKAPGTERDRLLEGKRSKKRESWERGV